MPDTNKNTPAYPAEWIGGRRRKLVRRNSTNERPPRLSTLPVLDPESVAAGLVNCAGSVNLGNVEEMLEEDDYDQRQEPGDIEGMMQYYEQSGLAKSGAPYSSFADATATSSHRPTATDSKRKQGLFGMKKPKALDRPNSSPRTPVVTSPLPPTTPSKAAQFFGLEPKPKITESPRRGQFQHDGILDGDASVRPLLQEQPSLPLLTDFEADAERQTMFREEDAKLDQFMSTKAGKTNATKGLRMLIPEFAGPRRAPTQQVAAAATPFDLDEDNEDIGYSSDSGLQQSRFRIPAAPRPVPVTPKRRVSKKNPKPLQRMSPITEASYEELRPVYRQREGVTELDVISEYGYDDTAYSGPVLPRSLSESVLSPRYAFELDEGNLSPMDEHDDEEATEEEDTVHPGTKVDLKRVYWQQLSTMFARSPLQSIEDDFLDATEDHMRLEARRMTLARIEAEKQVMDAEIAVLRREHERMMHSLDEHEPGNSAFGQLVCTPDECSDEYDDDLVSFRSSVDLNEKPTVHEAETMTITRVLPGMAKVVDIPPRTKKPYPYVGSNPPVPDKPISTEHKKKHVASLTQDENSFPISPVVTHYHHEDLDSASKLGKSKMTSEESRIRVQDWVLSYNGTEQRPLSTHVDPDVLADQETPPAPFPKSDEAFPTPPIKPRSDSLTLPKQLQIHQCINNGHIFHPIDLKHIPDNAVVNSLEVRPYLQTYIGVKQHIKIPVLCEKCGEDCDENVWECEIAVCRMAVCQSCAEEMEAEWQERAASGWKYKR